MVEHYDNIVLDVDGVLRNIHDNIIKTYKDKHSDKKFYDFDDIRHYDLRKTFRNIKLPNHFHEFKEEIFYNSPMQESTTKESVDDFKNMGYKITITTSQPKGLEDITLKWLNKHNIYYDSIHFTPNKNEVKGFIMIDDCIDNLKEFDGLPICYEQPWNEMYKGIKIKSLKDINSMIRKQN